MLRPLHKNVILQKEKSETEIKTASGIILSEKDRKEPSYAKVLAVGPEVEAKIAVNDRVVYKSYSGTDVKIDDEKYIVVADEDILAVLE